MDNAMKDQENRKRTIGISATEAATSAKRVCRRADNREERIVESQNPFLQLPSEVIAHICSFLDTDALKNLCFACKQLRRAFEGSFGICSLAAKREKLFHVLAFETAAEEQRRINQRWERLDSLSDIATMDDFAGSVRLSDESGRASLIYVVRNSIAWKNIESSDTAFCHIRPDRWVRDCLMTVDRTVFVCGRKGVVHSYTLANGAGFVYDTLREICPRGSVSSFRSISNCVDRKFFAVGTRKRVYLYDRRTPQRMWTNCYNVSHELRQIVLNAKHVFTIGESEAHKYKFALDIWDRRICRPFKTIPMAHSWCVALRHDWLCASGNNVYEVLNPAQNYNYCFCDYTPYKNATSLGASTTIKLCLTDKYLLTGYSDGTSTLSTPTFPTKLIATLRATEIGPLARAVCLNDTVAIAGKKGIAVWRRRC